MISRRGFLTIIGATILAQALPIEVEEPPGLEMFFDMDKLISWDIETRSTMIWDSFPLCIEDLRKSIPIPYTGWYPKWDYEPQSNVRDIVQSLLREETASFVEVDQLTPASKLVCHVERTRSLTDGERK